jgi:hypothetical protein
METVEEICPISEVPRLLVSRRSAAKALDISVRMIDYAIAAGLLETRRVNSRILIPADSLVRFAAADRLIPRTLTQSEGCVQ